MASVGIHYCDYIIVDEFSIAFGDDDMPEFKTIVPRTFIAVNHLGMFSNMTEIIKKFKPTNLKKYDFAKRLGQYGD
jgi:hypothetical protein